MSEDRLREDAVRAARARAILGDELFNDAFAQLEADFIRAWKNSDPRDDDGRQRIWQALQLLGKVRECLSRAIANGRLAEDEIERILADRLSQ